jgi:hypothetical protein
MCGIAGKLHLDPSEPAYPHLLRKLSLVGKDLEEFSLDTVRMFYEDARQAGYSL